jgi:hypothetical protein
VVRGVVATEAVPTAATGVAVDWTGRTDPVVGVGPDRTADIGGDTKPV